MRELLIKLFVFLLLIQNGYGYKTKQNTIPIAPTFMRNGKLLWTQLESSGLVPVEVNVQDTVTELATGMMQVWNNAQNWWQEIQSDNPSSRPNRKPTIIKPTIPEYLYEEEIPIVTNKFSTEKKLKKKFEQLKMHHKQNNSIQSVSEEGNVSKQKQSENTINTYNNESESKQIIKGEKVKKQSSMKKKKSKKYKKVTKVIDYKNYYYFFMGLFGIWPQF